MLYHLTLIFSSEMTTFWQRQKQSFHSSISPFINFRLKEPSLSSKEVLFLFKMQCTWVLRELQALSRDLAKDLWNKGLDLERVEEERLTFFLPMFTNLERIYNLYEFKY